MMRNLWTLAAAAAVIACAASARADVVAFTLGNNGFENHDGGSQDGSFTPGWQFTPTEDITVTALGFFTQDGNFSPPQTQGVLEGSHNVAIWQAGNSLTPVITGTVAATTTPVKDASGYTYDAIAPVTLTAGTTYYLMASIMVPTGSAAFNGNGTPQTITSPTLLDNSPSNLGTITYAPEIGYQHGVYIGSGPGTGTAAYPTNFDGDPGSYLVGTFQFTEGDAAPEPASIGLLGLGVLGLLARRRKA